jgi:hypothetical protein
MDNKAFLAFCFLREYLSSRTQLVFHSLETLVPAGPQEIPDRNVGFSGSSQVAALTSERNFSVICLELQDELRLTLNRFEFSYAC